MSNGTQSAEARNANVAGLAEMAAAFMLALALFTAWPVKSARVSIPAFVLFAIAYGIAIYCRQPRVEAKSVTEEQPIARVEEQYKQSVKIEVIEPPPAETTPGVSGPSAL